MTNNIILEVESDCSNNEQVIKEFVYEEFMNNIQDNNNDISNDNQLAQIKSYEYNYNVKELTIIAEYYDIKVKKLRKNEIIELIVLFENDENNIEIIEKRHILWSYLQELKEDPVLSKYVLW